MQNFLLQLHHADALYGDHLQCSSNWHAKKPKQDTHKPLSQSQWSGVCECTKKLNDYDLEDERCGEDSHKHVVV